MAAHGRKRTRARTGAVSGSFTVGAIAASSREANSVGAVRLTLLPKRLEVELLKSGSYADGYVPGPLTRSVRISAPYTAIRGLVRRGDGVLLSFDSRVVTPHNRFFLTHFSDAPLESLASAYRFRRVLGLVAWVAPLPLAVWLASQAPTELVSGAMGKAALIALGTLGFGALLRGGVAWTMRGGPLSERLLATLERRLSQRLGFDPALFHETDVADVPELDVRKRAGVKLVEPVELERDEDFPITQFMQYPPPVTPAPAAVAEPKRPVARVEPQLRAAPSRLAQPQLQAAPSRPTGAAAPTHLAAMQPHVAQPQCRDAPPPVAAPLPIAVPVAPPMPATSAPRSQKSRFVRAGFALAAMLVLTAAVAVFALREIPRAPAESEEPIAARAGMEAVDVPPDEILEAPTLPLCTCERADSPLWRGGVPVLSVIPVAKHVGVAGPSVITPQLSGKGRGKYNFDLAIVNNASESLSDLRVVVTFARRNDKGERVGATDRGFFWGGKLSPGNSVKWLVKGPGTELKIEVEERRLLEGPAAPADAFAKLLRSDKLPVSLHAATMLAYLGDARGKEHVKNLQNLAPPEASTKERILRASEPLKVCNVKRVSEDPHAKLSMCAWNGTKEKLWNLAIAEVDEGETARTVAIPEPIPKGMGLVIETDQFETDPEEVVLVRK